jgi:hypothetical protein
LRESEPDTARAAVLQALNRLPRTTIRLSHNLAANTEILAAIR